LGLNFLADIGTDMGLDLADIGTDMGLDLADIGTDIRADILSKKIFNDFRET